MELRNIDNLVFDAAYANGHGYDHKYITVGVYRESDEYCMLHFYSRTQSRHVRFCDYGNKDLCFLIADIMNILHNTENGADFIKLHAINEK